MPRGDSLSVLMPLWPVRLSYVLSFVTPLDLLEQPPLLMAFLNKPFTTCDLVSAVRRVLDKGRVVAAAR